MKCHLAKKYFSITLKSLAYFTNLTPIASFPIFSIYYIDN